ncbi:hypothetical protein HOY80DRAFT_1100995 [Tuber brumale]|nr:hypothetical protein HOY80DRAFT_1100995 [Tuber brumale]
MGESNDNSGDSDGDRSGDHPGGEKSGNSESDRIRTDEDDGIDTLGSHEYRDFLGSNFLEVRLRTREEPRTDPDGEAMLNEEKDSNKDTSDVEGELLGHNKDSGIGSEDEGGGVDEDESSNEGIQGEEAKRSDELRKLIAKLQN